MLSCAPCLKHIASDKVGQKDTLNKLRDNVWKFHTRASEPLHDESEMHLRCIAQHPWNLCSVLANHSVIRSNCHDEILTKDKIHSKLFCCARLDDQNQSCQLNFRWYILISDSRIFWYGCPLQLLPGALLPFRSSSFWVLRFS